MIIGKKGRDIPKAKAYDYVFGYTVCLDMTARELQRIHGQWFKGKARVIGTHQGGRRTTKAAGVGTNYM